MVFSSILFIFRFLPIALIAYYLAPGKLKNLVLFVLSLIFYTWGEPVYVLLMIFSTVVDYTHGLLVEKFKDNGNIKGAKAVVISSVTINLLLLCFFKYTGFILTTIGNITGFNMPEFNLPLPIGISFYTFQTMSYTIDVYRGDAKAQKNIISFGAYVALFPQLIAGPIVRYKTVAEQLLERKITLEGVAYGITRFVIGMGKKVLLANNIGLLWENISGMQDISVLTAWLGIVAYTFQIYFDFSGYSDMAIGLGAMFGFKFDENFSHPYESKSITEFWRRWHISLGTWFKEYVYIPLGGNRCSKLKNIRNIFIVWALTGIWHGASWNFMAWGLYFGILLILEKNYILKVLEKLPAFMRHLYTMILVIISWAIFACDSLRDGVTYIGKMFGIGSTGIVDNYSLYQLTSYGVVFLILIVGSTKWPVTIFNKIKGKEIVLNIYLLIVMLLSIAYIVEASYNPFLYFRF